MATHDIEPERRTLHGRFSRDLPPILTIEPGDSVRYRTLDADWWLERPPLDGSAGRRFPFRSDEHDRGHAMCGPIFIRGTNPGMTLEVEIGEIRTGDWGWSVAGGGNSAIAHSVGVAGDGLRMVWDVDHSRGKASNQFGHRVALRPFMGVMGMPPDEPGWHSSGPPRASGGNLDCKELISGSTLFLPIAVPGGLFSVGDGHAVQGDGEVNGTGIECPMDLVVLTFRLRDGLKVTTPYACTRAGWITFGFDRDLYRAAVIAITAMVDLLCADYNLGRPEALGIASLVVDLRVTQVANAAFGVHAVLPHGAIDVSSKAARYP